MKRRHFLQIVGLSGAILLATLTIDFIISVWLIPSATTYSPVATFAITLAVAPAFTYFLVRQNARVEQAHEAFALEQAARRAADDANEAKSRFLANMSHELRTPLNAIIGYSEMIEEESLALQHETNAEDARRVLRAGQHLLALINDVLDHAKIESGEMHIEPTLTPLAPLLSEVAEAVRAAARANGNQLMVACDSEIGLAYLDRLRFKQCLLNLASNAVKFTHDGTVTLRLGAEERNGAPFIRFDAIDTGIGLNDAARARLFIPFVQGQSSTTRLFGGTGLGLAITKSLIEGMGGSVSVVSQEGVGSTFTLCVPRTPAPAIARPTVAAAAAA